MALLPRNSLCALVISTRWWRGSVLVIDFRSNTHAIHRHTSTVSENSKGIWLDFHHGPSRYPNPCTLRRDPIQRHAPWSQWHCAGPGKPSTAAVPGSGSGVAKTATTDPARVALGRQKSGGGRVQKRSGGTAAAAAPGAASKANTLTLASTAPSAASITGVYEATSPALQSG